MAADDLVYTLDDGKAIPAERNVRKIFAAGNVLIGSAQLLRCRQRVTSAGDRESSETISIEYKFEDWIIEFIRAQRGTPNNDPETIADSLYEKARETLKPIAVLVERGDWGNQSPGDRIVTYLVAGYPKNFKNFYLFEFGIEINAEGNGLRYLPPFRHPSELPRDLFLGEDEFLLRALTNVEPQAATRELAWRRCLDSMSVVLPNIPASLQDTVASLVSLIKVEAQFNPNKVGTVVNVAIIERATRQHYLPAF